MGRLLVILVTLLGPLAVYLLWLHLVQRKAILEAEGRLPAWADLPWTWLIIAGVLLMGVTLVAMRFLDIDPDEWIGGESLVAPRRDEG